MTNEEVLIVIEKMSLEGCDALTIHEELSKLIDFSDDELKQKYRFELKKIDDYVVRYQLARQEKDKVLNQMIIGGVILIVGLGFTITSLAMKGDEFVFAYGAVLVGAWMLYKGYRDYRRPIEEFMPRDSIFRNA